MPRGNGTGPDGFGPMTGRAAGFCTGNRMPGFASGRGGRGMGAGRGLRGRGWGTGFGFGGYPERYPVNERYADEMDNAEYLKNIAKSLSDELELVNKRISDMEGRKAK